MPNGSHLVTLRRAAKTLVERTIGRDIKRIDNHAVVLIDKGRPRDAWYSYDVQLRWLLETHGVDLVIDVGANEGQFGERMRQLYAGDIVSFEPVTSAFAKLAEAARSDPRWTVHRLALGSADSVATIHVANDTKFSSFLAANDFSRQQFRRSAVASAEEVPVKRLCDVLEPLLRSGRRRIFLKLDTQGFDLEVFKGFGDYAAHVVLLQSEVSLINIYDGMPHWTESIDAYERAGLYVAGMFPVTRDPGGRVIEYDCLLVRENA